MVTDAEASVRPPAEAMIESIFTFHSATPITGPKHEQVRTILKNTATQLVALTPHSPEQTVMIRKLQEAMHYANSAIALHTPAEPDA